MQKPHEDCEKLEKMLTEVCRMIESVSKLDMYCSQDLKEWYSKKKCSRSTTDGAAVS